MQYTDTTNTFTYHIKDDYFQKMGEDKGLMKNKDNGGYRPNYYSVKDKNTDILWMIPISSKVDKYKSIRDKKISKDGHCYNIVIGKYCGKENAFLIQNMFPILPKYIDHVHTVKGNQVKVHKSIIAEINDCLDEVFRLLKYDIILPFTKIKELYELQLSECKNDSYNALNILVEQDEVTINLGETFDFNSILTVNNGDLSISNVDYTKPGEQKVIATVTDNFNQTKEVYINLRILKPDVESGQVISDEIDNIDNDRSEEKE